MNENLLFCCCFQAVLLLFSNFLRCFSRILTNFRFFSENFQNPQISRSLVVYVGNSKRLAAGQSSVSERISACIT
jgi:hypothetical protein